MKKIMIVSMLMTLASLGWADEFETLRDSSELKNVITKSIQEIKVQSMDAEPEIKLDEVKGPQFVEFSKSGPRYMCKTTKPDDVIKSFSVDLNRGDVIIVSSKNPEGILRKAECKKNTSIFNTPTLHCTLNHTSGSIAIFLEKDAQGLMYGQYVGLLEHPAVCQEENIGDQFLNNRRIKSSVDDKTIESSIGKAIGGTIGGYDGASTTHVCWLHSVGRELCVYKCNDGIIYTTFCPWKSR